MLILCSLTLLMMHNSVDWANMSALNHPSIAAFASQRNFIKHALPKPSNWTSEVHPSLTNWQSDQLIHHMFCLIWWLIIIMSVINAGSPSTVNWLDAIDWETTWLRNILAFQSCDFFVTVAIFGAEFLALLHTTRGRE